MVKYFIVIYRIHETVSTFRVCEHVQGLKSLFFTKKMNVTFREKVALSLETLINVTSMSVRQPLHLFYCV